MPDTPNMLSPMPEDSSQRPPAMADPAGSRLSWPQVRYISYVQRGCSEALARTQCNITSELLGAWKRNPEFSTALKAACQLRSVWHRADALDLADQAATPLMAEAIDLAYNSERDDVRLRAIAHVHGAVAIGTGNPGVHISTQAQQLVQHITLAIQPTTPDTT